MTSLDDDRLVSVELMAPGTLLCFGLPFLVPAEVLVVDCVDRQTRRAMASSHVELWRALVRSACPQAPFFPCESSSRDTKPRLRVPGSARLATWKDVFYLLITWGETNLRLEPGAVESAQRRATIHSGPDIVPSQRAPDSRDRLRVKLLGSNLLLDVSLASKDRKTGWILLRERVQIEKRLDSSTGISRLETMRHRLSTMSFRNEKESQSPPSGSHRGRIVLTDTHITGVVQSPLFPDIAIRIADAEVSHALEACCFTLTTSNANVVITTATPESAAAWVASITRLKPHAASIGKQDAPPTNLAATIESSQKADKLLTMRWKTPQLPRIRSFTCPGPSLFPRPAHIVKNTQALDKHTGGGDHNGASLSSGSALSTVFTKANRLFKSLSFTGSPNTIRYASAPAFLQQPRFASARRSFLKPPGFISGNASGDGGVLALVNTRRMKRASLSSTTMLEGSRVVNKAQRVTKSTLSPCGEHHHDNNSTDIVETAGTLDRPDGVRHRIHHIVFGLLQSTESFEGHIYSRFLERQQHEFLQDSMCPATCRSYLNKVRDCIQDLVQFILSFRLEQLELCLKNEEEEPQHENIGGHAAQELASLVQDAVEAYFFGNCFSPSLPARVAKWCSIVATIPDTAALDRKLAQWSALPAESDAFALSNPRHVEASASVQRAIGSLHAMGDVMTPSRKLAYFMDAVRALHAHSMAKSPAACGTVCDADELLPLLIFAVCRSRVLTPLAHCVAVQQLCAFASPYGECMYYLTMFETAIEFVRTHAA